MKRKRIKMQMALLMTMVLFSACGKQPENPDTTVGKVKTEARPEIEATEFPSTEEMDEQNPVSSIGVETGHYYDYYWNETYECVAASVKYPYMHLSEEDRNAYPELEQSLVELMTERKDNCMESYSEAIQGSADYLAEGWDYPSVFETSETVTVRRADTRVLSLMLDGYNYSGGIHGFPYSFGYNFDTRTGEQLVLTDVVTSVDALPELVEEQLNLYYDRDCFYEDMDLKEYFDEYLDNIAWVLDYHGITIYFNPYDIAPYASGIQAVTISFAEHPELFQEEYMEVPASYGIEFSLNKDFYYDVDGDNQLDALTISAYYDENGDYESQTIWLNDIWYEEETGTFEIKPTLIHTEDGKNYLYVGEQYLNDFWSYFVYDLSKGDIEKLDNVYSSPHSISNWEEDYYLQQVLTNPESFTLDTMTQIMGTVYGYAVYHIGENGLPVKEHDWYRISYEMNFTMLKDLSVSVVNEEGEIIGTTELKTGDTVLYYRTDGESWADLKLTDGSIVRVFPECVDWYWMIDGVNIEEIFDGIVYAG